jgi:site-specific recombinase XerD
MTELRRRYLRDLAIRGKAERTQESYTAYVADLARHYGRSPELISYEEVADWLYHLLHQRRLSPSSVNIAVNAVRFLYRVTLGRKVEELEARVPHCKRPTQRAQVYSVEEVEAILTTPRRPRDRAFLMTVYSAGLRVMEACTLRVPGGIDRARMQLRVEGKGAKERVLPLSPRVLEELERYWREERRGRLGERTPWLFIAPDREHHLGSTGGQCIYYRALRKSGVPHKGGIHVLRHSFATHLIESGVEIPLIQRLMGHNHLVTTARYLHVTVQRLDRVRSALDLIQGVPLPTSAKQAH